MKIEDLVGKSLEGFEIRELTEVYKTDVDGKMDESFGFFESEVVAKAFAGIQIDNSYSCTEKAFILTNGKVGFLMGESVNLVDNEEVALETRDKILAKLTPEDRAFLRLK